MNDPTIRVMFFTKDINMHLTPVLVKDELRKIYEKNLKLDEDLIINGWDDLSLNLPEDVAYLNLLISADTVKVNGGLFKIIERQIGANIPRTLWIIVEPIKK